jgi:exopolyphosphatase/guanosine-5'-triphosphate,3'-diphosphate pyrophosphatase
MWIKPPETVAAVDLGSNSFHMIVSKLEDGQLHTIDRMRETVRLAAGLDLSRRLTEAASERAIGCLQRFGQRLREMPRGSVRAVGTNTLRRAKNSAEFLCQAVTALGHPIEIISGIEEARLIYLGVAQSLEPDHQKRLVIDIGGGSTEFIIGTGTTPLRKESLHMGCVSMSERHFPDSKINARRMKRAVIAAQLELESIWQDFYAGEWQQAVGSSGTFRAVAKAIQSRGWSNTHITAASMNLLVDYLIEAGDINQIQIPELAPDRLPVFPGGVAIVQAAFKTLGIEAMQVSDGALREGLLYDLLGRIYRNDVRENSVKALAERYHTNSEHAGQIVDTLRACIKQIEFPAGVNPEIAVQYLEWAARLHEIGLDIAHNKYHKHGAYIIEHADMAGFSQQEQKLLAALVRAHRRKFADKQFDDLFAPWNCSAKYLSILLRLAVILHRSRHLNPLPDFRLVLESNRLAIDFPEDWLNGHPLTQADLQQEAVYLDAAGFQLEFR